MQRTIRVMTVKGWPEFTVDTTCSDEDIAAEVRKRHGLQPNRTPHDWAYRDTPVGTTVPSKK